MEGEGEDNENEYSYHEDEMTEPDSEGGSGSGGGTAAAPAEPAFEALAGPQAKAVCKAKASAPRAQATQAPTVGAASTTVTAATAAATPAAPNVERSASGIGCTSMIRCPGRRFFAPRMPLAPGPASNDLWVKYTKTRKLNYYSVLEESGMIRRGR
jgi:hypothetical protein